LRGFDTSTSNNCISGIWESRVIQLILFDVAISAFHSNTKPTTRYGKEMGGKKQTHSSSLVSAGEPWRAQNQTKTRGRPGSGHVDIWVVEIMREIFRLHKPFRERNWKDVEICFRLCREHSNEKLLQNGEIKSSMDVGRWMEEMLSHGVR